jgi:hypothetical protein
VRLPERSLVLPDLSVLRPGRWLFAPGSARQLAALRIGLCSVLALRLALRPDLYTGLADQPAALFRPLSFMKLLPHMPPRGVVTVVLAIGVTAAVLAAVGLKARMALPIAWVCAAFLDGMTTSQGKVMHNDVLLLLSLVPLIPAPVSDRWSLDALLARRRGANSVRPELSADYGWPVRTAILVICGAYFLIGLHKLQFSGLAWATTDNLRWVLYASSDARGGDSLGLFIADHPLLAHVFAWATLAVEIGFPIVLLLPWTRWIMVPGVIGLHSGIWLTMGLNYLPWILTVLIVFVNWPAVAAQAHRALVARRSLGAVPART